MFKEAQKISFFWFHLEWRQKETSLNIFQRTMFWKPHFALFSDNDIGIPLSFFV